MNIDKRAVFQCLTLYLGMVVLFDGSRLLSGRSQVRALPESPTKSAIRDFTRAILGDVRQRRLPFARARRSCLGMRKVAIAPPKPDCVVGLGWRPGDHDDRGNTARAAARRQLASIPIRDARLLHAQSRPWDPHASLAEDGRCATGNFGYPTRRRRSPRA